MLPAAGNLLKVFVVFLVIESVRIIITNCGYYKLNVSSVENKPKKHIKDGTVGSDLLTAQVAFLSQGDAQVAVSPAKGVSQEC